MVNENGAAGLKLHALHQADYAVVRVKNALDKYNPTMATG